MAVYLKKFLKKKAINTVMQINPSAATFVPAVWIMKSAIQ
jgi:hypothetical protein